MTLQVSELSIFVRHAVADDSGVLQRHQELALQEATQYRGSVLSSPKENKSCITLVAGIGSSVMGSLIASNDGSENWSIDSVFVDALSREIGIGDALVLACLTELQQRDATWVQSSALPGDRAMKNLFERHGLVAQTIIVGKSL
jgi:ribosomal protein S18 acetylase RimI-like enzyme